MTQRPVVVITGASRGIGRATAERLAAAGFDLALAARRPEPLAEAAASVEASGVSALAVPTDVGIETEVAALFERVVERFGRVDALINSAGHGRFAPVEEI